MKNPNPIIPPGMNLDKSRRGRSNMRIAVVVIVMVHIALFGGILFNACSQKDDGAVENAEPEENKIARNTPPDIPSPGKEVTDAGPLSSVGVPAGEQASGPFSGTGGGSLPSAAGDIGLSSSTGADTGTDVTSDFPTLPPAVGTSGATEHSSALSSTVGTEHTILSGEHFTSIAKKYGVTVRAIQNANLTLDSRRLRIGQKVKIPPPTVVASSVGTDAVPLAVDEYVIQRGDSLSTIALRHSTTVKALRAANNLRTDLILAGEKLKLPPSSRFSNPTPSTGTGGFPASLPGTE
jgi:LysM repeat protein